MKKSRYFAELGANYSAEIDDLVSDSEGKSVLKQRLDVKRREIQSILPMISFSPEMVAVAFYGAFGFKSPEVMQRLALSEPGKADFLSWGKLEKHLMLADWAEHLVDLTLTEEGGEEFLVTTAALEYLRTHDVADAPPPAQESDNDGRNDDDEDGDLREQGADWMTEQGFDPLES